jgi:hypothetical protein
MSYAVKPSARVPCLSASWAAALSATLTKAKRSHIPGGIMRLE